jgi:hypothetical protein
MHQTIAKVFGWVFILVGVIGFFSGSATMTAGPELGLFPVNVVHNVAHILIGLWGVNAARTATGAMAYCKQAGVLYLLLAILGFIPATVDMFANLAPLGGNDRYLHLVLGLVLCYVGFMGNSRRAATT